MRRNLVTNPSAEVDLTSWVSFLTNATLNDLSRTNAWAGAGSWSAHFKATATAGGAAAEIALPNAATADGFPVTAGTTYTAQAKLNVITKPANGQKIGIAWLNSSHGVISFSPSSAVPGTGVSVLSVTAVAPVGAVSALVVIGHVSGLSNTLANAEVTEFDADAVLLEAAATVGDYFDGSTGPHTNWDGIANASTSTQDDPAIFKTSPSIVVPPQDAPEVLTWEITDLNQKVLSRLDNRKPGAKITIPQNDARKATVTLDPSDPALAAGLAGSSAASAGLPMLDRALRARIIGHGDPWFCGRIMAPDLRRKNSDRLVTLNAFDPWATELDRDLIHDLGTPGQLRYTRIGPADQSEVIWRLVDYGIGNGNTLSQFVSHRVYVDTSSYPASFNRTRSYAVGRSLGDAIRELTQLGLGPDVEFAPINDGGNATALCALKVYYPKRGSDKSSSVVFEYGHGRQSAIEHDLAPGDDPCNYFIAVGAAATQSGDWRIACIAKHPGSIVAYGRLADYEERTDTTDTATLQNYAMGQVAERQQPIPFFTFTQAPQYLAIAPNPTTAREGAPPSFGPNADYYLGDTIALRVQPDGTDDPELQQTYTGRVTDAELTELANGQVQVQCDCATEIDTSSVQVVTYLAYMPDLSTV